MVFLLYNVFLPRLSCGRTEVTIMISSLRSESGGLKFFFRHIQSPIIVVLILFATSASTTAQQVQTELGTMPLSVWKHIQRDKIIGNRTARQYELQKIVDNGPSKPFPPPGTVCPEPILKNRAIQDRVAKQIPILKAVIEKYKMDYHNLEGELAVRFGNYRDPVWEEYIGSYRALAYVCFPQLKTLYLEFDRSAQPEAEARLKIQKAEEEERNKPENKLSRLYQLYINVKACHAARSGYLVVMINDEQMNKARIAVKMAEQQILHTAPSLDTNAIWKTANDRFKGSPADIGIGLVRMGSADNFETVKSMCTLSYEQLVSGHGQSVPMKKDF
jgi:hypothetical protein